MESSKVPKSACEEHYDLRYIIILSSRFETVKWKHVPSKSWIKMLILCHDCSFARLIAPAVTTIFLIISSNQVQSACPETFWCRLNQVVLENGRWMNIIVISFESEIMIATTKIIRYWPAIYSLIISHKKCLAELLMELSKQVRNCKTIPIKQATNCKS